MALASRLPEARYVQSPENLKKRLLEGLGEADLVLVLGAGDIYDIVREMLAQTSISLPFCSQA